MAPFSRRQFLRRAATGGAALGFPLVVPAAALGRDGKVPPSNRVTLGVVGTGGMGMNNLRGFMAFKEVQVLAVCDVDRHHRERARRRVDKRHGKGACAAYTDYRRLTRRPDIDGVCIATPDHWHTLPALDAAAHGKDLYVEKPLTLTVSEGIALRDTVRRHGRVLQTGSHQRSGARFRHACELVRNGRLGRITRVEVTIPGNNRTCTPSWKPEPVPEELDYDLWLGPAPWQPYHHQRCHYQFRFIMDYSGGQVTNWGAHFLDIAQWGLDMDASGPVEVTGRGEFPRTGLFNTATKVDFDARYASGVELTCKTGYQGTKFIGTEGWLFVNRSTLRAGPASILSERIGPGEIRLQRSDDHRADFLRSIRTRREPVAGVEVGHRSATLCHLGNLAMRLGTTLRWDPAAERFLDNDAANRLLTASRRGAWSGTR